MSEPINIMTDEDESFNVKKFIARILDHWKLYVASVILFLGSAWLYVHYATPLYRANAQVLVESKQSGGSSSFLSSGAGDFGDIFSVKNNITDEIAILQTPDLFKRVVPVLNLNVAYYHKGNIRAVELYDHSPFYIYFEPISDSIGSEKFELNAIAGKPNSILISNEDGFSKTIKYGDTIQLNAGRICISCAGAPLDNATYIFTLSSMASTAGSLMPGISVSSPDKKSNVINLSFTSNVPKKAEDILRTLITKYFERSLNEKNRTADSLLAFIDGRINLVANDLNNIEARIQGFKQENKLTNLEAQSTALIGNTSDYYNKLTDVDVQLNVMKIMLESVQQDTKRPVPALSISDPGLGSLVEKYNILLTQREKLLLSTTEINPLIKNIDGQMASVRSDIIRSLQNQQQALQISRQKIQGANTQIGNMVANAPVQERKYIDLSRERDVKQALYLFLLQKKEETAITKASTIPGASVIREPKSEGGPFFPSSSNAYGIGLALGLLVPFAFLSLKSLLNNHINTTDDITNHTNVPIIAEIGHSLKEGLLSMEKDGRSPLAEQFRVFRTNMDFLTAGKSCPIILITSFTSGEGKSFISSNLSQIYGYSGKRVILMEMDLRKPKISQMLGLSNDKGFSNYIIADKPASDFIRAVPNADNVFLMSSGSIPPNPAELLMSKKMEAMFQELTTSFDVIVIDSPPIGIVTDAQIIGAHANVSLFVVRPGYTFKDSISTINNIADNKKLDSFYILVNDIKAGNSYKYGYGYGYNYYNEHGATRKKNALSLFQKK